MEHPYEALLDGAPQEWRFDKSLGLVLLIFLSVFETDTLSLLEWLVFARHVLLESFGQGRRVLYPDSDFPPIVM
jgi:hypothetical protein